VRVKRNLEREERKKREKLKEDEEALLAEERYNALSPGEKILEDERRAAEAAARAKANADAEASDERFLFYFKIWLVLLFIGTVTGITVWQVNLAERDSQ
jgi:hypothetical protein